MAADVFRDARCPSCLLHAQSQVVLENVMSANGAGASIDRKLGFLRKEMNRILEKRRELLNLECIDQADAESGRESLRVQLSITVLLGALLVGAAYVVPT